MNSISRLIEKFNQIESRHNALSLEVAGVKFWLALRLHIYYELSQKLGLLDLPHQKPMTFYDRLRNSLGYIRNTIFHNPFFSKRSNTLIIPHSRKVLVGGVLVDIYTDDLSNLHKEALILEKHDGRKHQGSLKNGVVAYDFFLNYSAWILDVFFSTNPNDSQLSIIRAIENDIRETFSVNIDILNKAKRFVGRFKAEEFLVKKFLRVKKVKKIFLVVSYGHPAIISAAKTLEIPVTEIQHGVITRFHLGYHFPRMNAREHTYFPDELIVWADMWKDAAKFPIPDTKILVRELEYFSAERERFKGVKKLSKRILCLSQGVNGDRIAAFLESNINSLDDYDIVFKLHPSEYSRWRDYQPLVRLASRSNVEVVADGKTNIHELMQSSEFALGVFSTAMFEALDYQCKLLILNLPGFEYMSFLLERGDAKLVDAKSDLKTYLQ